MVPPCGDEQVAAVLDLLTFGDLAVEGQLVDASNLALLGRITVGDVSTPVMYKPVSGERPLWDFPDGTLANREAAAFVVSVLGGWDVVPPTVLRDGPLGPGTVQLWIGSPDAEHDSSGLIDIVAPGALEPGWLPVFEAQLSDSTPVVVAHADRPDLAGAAVFDAVVNNADRKGSHLVLDERGSLWGFDHGVTFHAEDKLRTVLWGWAGRPIGDADAARLERLAGWLGNPRSLATLVLRELLNPEELRALRGRVLAMLRAGRYPGPGGRWPAVPWPPL